MNDKPEIGTLAFAPGLLDKARLTERIDKAGVLSNAIKGQIDSLRSVLADLSKRSVKTGLTDVDIQEIRPDLDLDLLSGWLDAAQDLIDAFDLVKGNNNNPEFWSAMEKIQ